MRFPVLLALSLTLAISQAAFAITAAGNLDLTASTQLRLLELKYFEHTFDSQSAEERVERIEKLVRGDVIEGDPGERIKSIAATLEAEGESLAPEHPLETSRKMTAARNPSRDNAGSPQNNTEDEGPQESKGSSDRGDYPHVSNLEKEILGKTFTGDTLEERVSRLESKAFGRPTRSNDYSSRTDRLEDYAEKVLHDKPFAINPDIDKTYIIPSSRQSYRTGSTSAPSLAQEEESVIEHFFGSSRRVPDPYSRGESNIASNNDDPAVYQKSPPPQGSRMITQVGWCEVQVFGHTFPHMHLTDRLRQLNNQVLPKSARLSDMQLMDDLGPILKAVSGRKSQSIGSGAGGIR